MLRDKSLIPLSHQHQHALALCVRMDRARPIVVKDLPAWLAEIRQAFEAEIKIHFSAEEAVVFPEARRIGLDSLVDELLADHVVLRKALGQAEAGRMSADELQAFGERLAGHIRKEERQLFEGMQKALTTEQLAALGERLEVALKDSVQACAVPNETTRLRAAK